MSDDLSESIRDLDLPASGPKLQEVRESIRTAYEFLRQRESATPAEIQAAVYPEYEASHTFADETPDSWYETYLVAGFEQLPSVERDGEAWRVRP